jgi:hypothetical protein
MSAKTKRGRRDSGGAGRPNTARASAPRGRRSPDCFLNATNPESLKDASAETQGMATVTKALERWENEGGRVLQAGQWPSEWSLEHHRSA